MISRILQHSADAGVLARRLVDLAKWCGGPDNATVAILPSGRTVPLEKIEDFDALVVWDAFGELQLDLGRPPLRFGTESSYQSQPKGLRLDRNENEGDPKLFETQLMPEEDAGNLGKVNPSTKKSKPRGRQPKDKAPEKVVEKAVVPQLDIKFSSKPE